MLKDFIGCRLLGKVRQIIVIKKIVVTRAFVCIVFSKNKILESFKTFILWSEADVQDIKKLS